MTLQTIEKQYPDVVYFTPTMIASTVWETKNQLIKEIILNNATEKQNRF